MRENKIRYVFFDLGGVVLSFKGGFTTFGKALGIPPATIERAYFAHADMAAHGVISGEEFWTRIRADLNLLQDTTIADYQEFWTDSFVPISETHQLLRHLAASHRLGILSNTEFGVYERILRKGHVPDIPFEVVIRSCEVGCVKPENRIYELAQERAGVEPHEILFIDDRPENIHAAQMLGWHGIVFDEANPRGSVQEIRKRLGC
jgi:epoxide hydrolase-like predicted phosphatase